MSSQPKSYTLPKPSLKPVEAMRVGRIGVGEIGEIYVGDVYSNEYRIYKSNSSYINSRLNPEVMNVLSNVGTIAFNAGSSLDGASNSATSSASTSTSDTTLSSYLLTFSHIIATGIMNKVYSGERLLDHLINILGTEWVRKCIIPSLNIVYASERNRVVGYHNVFNKGNSREVVKWVESDVAKYTSGTLYTLSKLALEATLDFILTSTTPERYKEIMEKARSEYEKFTSPSFKAKRKRSDIFAASEIASYWEHSVKVGEVFRAGVGQDAGLLVSRDRSKGIFTEVDDSRFYIINLFGFKNRLRFGSKVSLGSLIELITQQREDYPLSYIHDRQSIGFQKACDIAHDNLTRKLMGSHSYSDFLEYSNEFIKAYKGLIDEVKRNLEAYIYEVTQDYISFAVGANEDIGKALKVISTATNKYMPNMFEVLSLDANGTICKYWEYSTINCIPLQLLALALNEGAEKFTGTDRLKIVLEFERVKGDTG